MKRVISHIIGICLCLLAILPPFCDEIKIFTGLGGETSTWQLDLPVVVNSFLWVYLVVIIGLFVSYLFFCKINPLIKVIISYLYLISFYSVAPYISFNAMLLIVPAIYLFMLIQHKADKSIIINWIVALFWFEVALCFMQWAGKDVLINFDRPGQNVFLGTVMQHMRSGSLFAIMAPFLLLRNRLYIIPLFVMAFLESASNFGLALAAGAFIYLFLSDIPRKHKVNFMFVVIFIAALHSYCNIGSFRTALSVGRVPAWIKIFQCCYGIQFIGKLSFIATSAIEGLKHSLFGWGLNTFYAIYPALIRDPNPFAQCHNDWLQFLFEIGGVGLGLIMLYCINLYNNLYLYRQKIYIAGLVIIGVNMFFAFPSYMPPQTPLLMLAFIALCEQKIKEIEND